MENRIKEILHRALGSAVEITTIQPLKKGMTNNSFLVVTRENESFVLRINGVGTERLLDRRNEQQVYRLIANKGLSEELIALDPQEGYKLTRFISNARTPNPRNPADVFLCMAKLRDLHSLRLKTPLIFNVFQTIIFYESLWLRKHSRYPDYGETKQRVFALQTILSYCDTYEPCLSHIDAVHDNFLIDSNGHVFLLDWEYAAMCDPCIDLAMFSIYAGYSQSEVDHLIDLYNEQKTITPILRLKVYCYIAASGLLWSNWCEYKEDLGVHFSEYAQIQYEYAQKYPAIAQQYMEKCDAQS